MTCNRKNLFISHSWRYSTDYSRLVDLLNNRTYFPFYDYSVPKDDPIEDCRTDAQLKVAITARMKPASVAIFLAGVYATHSKWIRRELEIAREMDKPILAIKPRGNERVSTLVAEAADETVNWNTESIVAAIRRLAK